MQFRDVWFYAIVNQIAYTLYLYNFYINTQNIGPCRYKYIKKYKFSIDFS